ncbi:MAG: hypothetical protein ASUL_07864 [Candidatus Aramenus sulfurataquae]|uniref:Uncharacterized protein n=1 Tax=Candidatus Aramenus sulfurataquae TaxID=1326980 RepID=W7KVS1_9CREN|nr:MAG: hypothetical protein ASUL_07864 [Candidatus Aramenus sulfurataquae]
MNLEEFLNCGAVKCLKTGQFCVEVDGIRVLFNVEVNLGAVTQLKLKSANYKVNCNVEVDTRTERVISVECVGFKEEKIRLTLLGCFKERGLLHKGLVF